MFLIEKEGRKICYQATGNKQHPCLILIAGITGQLINWSPDFIDALATAGFYVVTFDNRDVGLSSYYDHLETPSMQEIIAKLQQGQPVNAPYSYHDMADDIRLLMDELNISKAHIAGNSMGGQIAQVFALDYPERTISLTLVATTSGDRDLSPPTQEVTNFFFNGRPITNIAEAIERHIAQYKIYLHPDDFDAAAARTICEKAYARAYHPAGNQRQLIAMLTAHPRGEALQKIMLPTFIIHGDYDPVFPLDHGQRLADVLENSELCVIPNMGHGLPKRAYTPIIEALSKFKGGVCL